MIHYKRSTLFDKVPDLFKDYVKDFCWQDGTFFISRPDRPSDILLDIKNLLVNQYSMVAEVHYSWCFVQVRPTERSSVVIVFKNPMPEILADLKLRFL